jgi:putative ABC transport system permease protein
MRTLWQDLRYGLRMLRKTPGFTTAAVATLALGIGFNTAIFSVVNAVLLRALPYHNSDRLIALFSATADGERDGLSTTELHEFQDRMTSFEDLAGFQSQSVNVTGGERPDRVRGAFVSASFFKVFDLTPVIGRTFAEGEDKQGAQKLVVVNEKLWRERLNSDPTLATKKLVLNGEPYSVVGVISSDFKNPFDPDVEVWLSMANYPGESGQRDSRFLNPLGHLKPGVDMAQAQAEARIVAAQLAAAYPKENSGRGAKVDSYGDLVVNHVRPMLWLLFAAVGVILLIACANLANLLLARGLARQREIAVRAALGASSGRLVRQLMTETMVISLVGGALGSLMAYWGLYALLKLPQTFVRAEDVTLDARVLLFTLAVSMVTGWLFGLVPAVQLARPRLQSFLKEGARGSGGGARWNRVRGSFVVAQVAMALLLLAGAGLLIRSFDKLLRVNLGFNPEQLLTLEYRLPHNKYPAPEAQWQFHHQLIEQIQGVPGVKSVSLARGVPFSGNGESVTVVLPDREPPPKGTEPQVMFNTVTPNYFEAMSIPFSKGRPFSDQDQLKTTPVFIINQTMARKFWPNQDPIGKQITLPEDRRAGTVIGVVGDAKHYWIDEDTKPQMYEPYSQDPGFFATVVVRTSVDPLSLSEPVRQAVWKVDPDQPMWKIRTVEFLVERSVADRKFLMALMGIFAALALVLTAIGLYGVINYLVNQRTQEIGIRMALGAQVGDILRMVLKQGMTLVLIGVALGLATAWPLTRLIAGLLYQVSATDPFTYTAIALVLITVGSAACYLPARRAAKVDPLVALRYE